MISEVVVLLALLGFLCIRNEYVQRRGPFLLSILFWGTARILMEMNFRTEPTGELKYNWASHASVLAAGCLIACLACVFWACWRRHTRHGVARVPKPDALVQGEEAVRETPSDRIKRLVEEVDQGAKQ